MSATTSQPQSPDSAALAERDRRAALDRYQILDTPQELAFDRFVRLAALLLDVPIALISLIDADRQWFKSRYGLDSPETPRALAFCDHAIRGRDVMVVPDAEQDPRFQDNALVTGDPHIRFYAGAPLVTPDGFALGTICAIDRAPRQLSARDAAVLTALAEQVIHELEVRSALGELYEEVAEGRRATRTLQGEGARLEALLNATGNAVITTDADGRVASLNRAADAMFGFDGGEAVGRHIDGLISNHLQTDCEVVTESREGSGRRKDGTEFPIAVSRAEWIDADGRKASGAVLQDLTERRRIEDELRSREVANQNQEKLAALGRVAGGVAHELNNLLQPVIGLTELELDSLPKAGTVEQMELRENLATILECGSQMRSIVCKILLFSRKANAKLVLIDFPSALWRAVAFARKMLPEGVRVEQFANVASGLAAINEAELIEVIMNLSINAADAMDGRGVVSISIDRVAIDDAASKTLDIHCGNYFTVEVRDAGHGMDAATKSLIFEPFFTTKKIGQGTGLGLSMVYGVLRGWKGAIAVDSSLGCGSIFTLYIPAPEA